MKICALLSQLNQDTYNHIRDTINSIATNYHLSDAQIQQVTQYYKFSPSSTFQQLYSSSMLRCDSTKYSQIVDEINDEVHKFFQSRSTMIQEIMAQEKNAMEEEIVPPPKIQQSQEQQSLPSQSQIQQSSQQQPCSSQLTVQQQNVQINQAVLTQPTQSTQIEINDEIQLNNSIKKKYQKIRSPSAKEAKCEQCVCQGTRNQGDLILCILCLNYLHLTCLGATFEGYQKGFVCPICILKHMDHFNKVKKILVPPSPFRTENQINHKPFSFLCDQSIIDIRCVRMDTRISSEEITWPDIGELFLNTKKIADFRALPLNSSLKKRKDDRILTSDVLANNCLQIKECIPTPEQRSICKILIGCQYFLAVFTIEQFTSKQLIEQILNTPENWMSIEQAQDFITLYLNKHEADEVKVDSLSVSLTCSLSFNMMNTPVRGIMCNHIQCFGLENYIMAMYSMQPRRWRCPICKQKLYGIQIDAYQLGILHTIKKYGKPITEIAFDNQGKIANGQLLQQMTLDFLPPFAIKNNNRIIQLEILSSSSQNVFPMSTPLKTKEATAIAPTLQNVISNMMLSTNQHLRANSYANFFAQNYYSNQMKMQQQARLEEQHRKSVPQQQKKSSVGQNNDQAILIE